MCFKIVSFFSDFATRRCSENGFWLDESGAEKADPSWTNFNGCFTPEITKVLDGFYSNISGNKPPPLRPWQGHRHTWARSDSQWPPLVAFCSKFSAGRGGGSARGR